MIRAGVVEYLNALPLWHALRDDPDIQLIPGVPSALSAMLAAGEIDIGLLPVIEYFRVPDVQILPGVCIGADGPVASVRLFHRVEIANIKRVILDTSSRTSAALTEIILAESYGLAPRYVTGTITPDGLATLDADAALMIGDPALVALKTSSLPSLDLGNKWKKHTGLPFVFAAWLGRSTMAANPRLVEKLQMAAMRGLETIPSIAWAYSSPLGLEPAYVTEYLSRNLRYELDERAVMGLKDFGRRASSRGLCPARPVIIAML